MEVGTGGGREISTGSSMSAKTKEHYNNTNREIDHQHLAYLLRESAELVERGEFGSILYEALQDFRAYYKQKYPKTGKKKKSTKKSPRPGAKPAVVIDEKFVSSSGAILEDLKESEKNAENIISQEDGKSKLDDDLLLSERSFGAFGESANATTSNDPSDPPETGSEKVIDAPTPVTADEASKVDDDEDDDDDKPSVSTTAPIARVDISSGPPTPPRGAREPTDPVEAVPGESAPGESASALGESAPVESAPSESAAPTQPTVDAPGNSFSTSMPSPIPSPFASSSTPTRGAVFGKKKFKLGVTLQSVKKGAMNVRKAAKNATENISEIMDKKHRHRHSTNAREELEFYAETGVDMAQSSKRRTYADADGYSSTSQDNVGSYEFKSRVTRGVAGASDAGSLASSEHELNSENAGENFHFSHDNHGRPVSDRSSGQPVSNSNLGRPGNDRNLPPTGLNQGVPQRPGSNLQFNSYPAEASENGESSYDSVGDHIRANSRTDSVEVDPIMEVGTRPKFQRPDNAKSSLIVSGWIEQYRRSKMRYVWKEVLASLVEGRKPGEVTTLWIQREIFSSSTGLRELEALHRIPVKILEEVTFSENTTDHQFRLKIYNGTEDFVFRCEDGPNDALRWVQILKEHKQLSERTTIDGEVKDTSTPYQQPQSQSQHARTPSTKGMAIRDLRAICHGAGVNTAGMERAQLEAAADRVQQQGTYFDQWGSATGTGAPHVNTQPFPPEQQKQYPSANHVNTDTGQSSFPPPVDTEIFPPQQEEEQPKRRMGIKELRAICHGAGINTAGMERRELEAAAKEVESRGTFFPPPTATQTASDEDIRARQEELRRKQHEQQKNEEVRRRMEAEERHLREVEEAQRRAAAVEQEARRRAAEEEARRRAYEEEQRRRAEEEQARIRAAAEEQLRRQREAEAARARYMQQQAAWQQQQHVDEQRRRAAEQQAAAEKRRRDDAIRKEQEWSIPATGAQTQQPHHYHQPQQQQFPQKHGYPQAQWQQQRPPPQQHYQRQPQNHSSQQQHYQQQPQQPTPPPPQQQQRQHSGTDSKYAKMANQSDDDGQAAITKIKHSVLIQWALQPPQLQMLRPIAALVTTIHTVFPPALGVSAHEYFKKWKPITREEVAGVNGQPEEAKLKKAVRKIRFFLHPDKLPHDLDEEQKFTVKMLWDVTSDAWEEYQKHKDDLDWVN